jgi:branched-chain amino acid transport system permease protein
VNLYLIWLYRWGQHEILAIPARVIALAFVLLLMAVPLITREPYLLRILTLAGIFAIYAASWDLLAGFTGQTNLGHALFFGVSVYTAALLNIHLRLPPWLSIPSGSLAAVLVGLIAGLPALRLRGFYLALVTLAFPIILQGIIFIFPELTGGELGLSGITPLPGSRVSHYYIVQLAMVCFVLVMVKFTDAGSKMVRTGVIFHAIREDEITARASGIDTTRYKLFAFAMSGLFAGVAGGLYAHYLRVAGPSTLELGFSFQAILWAIFGGITTIYGAVVGVYILYPLMEVLRLNPVGEKIQFVVFALVLISTLLFMPEGLARWVRDKLEVKCPRCKIVNGALRTSCRICRAPLYLGKDASQ